MKTIKFLFFLKFLFLILALSLLILLLFFTKEPNLSSDDNILFVLDISHSMNAQDIHCKLKECAIENKISRLEAAKLIIKKIITSQKSENMTNYGLLVFSQVAIPYIPLTFDTGTFFDYLENINTGLLPVGGTDRSSLNLFFSGNINKYSSIFFLSDVDLSLNKNYDHSFIKSLPSKKYLFAISTQKGASPRLPNGTLMKMRGKEIISHFDLEDANHLASSIGANLLHIDTIDSDQLKIIEKNFTHGMKSLSYPQIQIFLFLLCFLVLFLL